LEIYKNNLAGRTIRFLAKLMIRYFPKSLLNVFSALIKKINFPEFRYFYYFLSSRIFERDYLSLLKDSAILKAVRKKNEWAYFILESSFDKNEVEVAEHYLSTLSKFGYADYNKSSDYLNDEIKKISHNSKEVFYLYGPNASNPPDIDYRDCTLVVTKDIEQNVDQFRDSILFLNHIYYRTKIENDQSFKEKLLNKYGKIYISSMLPIQDIEFEHSKMLPCSDLCGSMALGRIFYNLLLKNGSFKCIIEGYDQYIITKAYSNHYPTLTRINNNIDEQKVVQGLADHDPLYNFLIVKELSKHINFYKSDNFTQIINMSGDEYIKKLIDARDFSLLS